MNICGKFAPVEILSDDNRWKSCFLFEDRGIHSNGKFYVDFYYRPGSAITKSFFNESGKQKFLEKLEFKEWDGKWENIS